MKSEGFSRVVVSTDFSACSQVGRRGGAAGLTVRAMLRTGVPHEAIVPLASDELADVLVIGTHGRGGLSRVLLGSVADRVVRLAPCPVLTVRGPA